MAQSLLDGVRAHSFDDVTTSSNSVNVTDAVQSVRCLFTITFTLLTQLLCPSFVPL